MKQIILIISLIILSSCSGVSIDDFTQPSGYWDLPARKRMHISAGVYSIKENQLTDNDELFFSEFSFDESGNLLKFETYENSERNKALPFWLPQNAVNYYYEYSDNRLVRLTVDVIGANPVVYSLSYDGSDRYTYIDLQAKSLGPLLIRGVSSIVASDGSYAMSWTDDRLSVEQVTSGVRSASVYNYEGSLLPLSAEVVIYEGLTDRSEHKETIRYTYHTDGAFNTIHASVEQYGDIYEVVQEYNTDGQLISYVNTSGDGQVRKYKYNSRGYLIELLNQNIMAEEIGRMSVIYDLDHEKNWIRSEQSIKGFIDWNMREGTVVYTRKINYRKVLSLNRNSK